MELVHEGGQLRAILDLDLDADDGEAVLRAAGVQTQHKGFGGGEGGGDVQQQVQPVLADRLDGGGIAVIGIGAPETWIQRSGCSFRFSSEALGQSARWTDTP